MSYAVGIDFNDIEHIIEINIEPNVINCNWIQKTLKSLIIYDENNKLHYLMCYNNSLESLIIHGGKNIKYIDCKKNNLTNLDLSKCENLQYLDCDITLENNLILPNNNKIKQIDYYD